MKKMAKMVLMMVVLMSTACAYAEQVKLPATVGMMYKTDYVDIKTTDDGKVEDIYFLTVESDYGESISIQVTYDEWIKVYRDEQFAKKNFWQKVVSVVTFWNADD